MDILIGLGKLFIALLFICSSVLLASCTRNRSRDHWSVRLYVCGLGASLCLAGLEILLYWPPLGLWHATTSVLLSFLILRGRGKIARFWRAR